MGRSRRHRGLLVPVLVAVIAVAAAWRLFAGAGGPLPAPAGARSEGVTTAAAPRGCPDAERLARRFAPALVIAPDDQAPRPVELFLDRAYLVYRDGERHALQTVATASALAGLADQPEAFLALPPAVDDAAAQRRLYEQAIAGDRAGRYPVTAYAGVHCDATNPALNGHTVIQYWLFYLYNDATNKHEGDWELIQVVLGPDNRPQFAAYAQHNSYTWRDWSEVLVETGADERDPDGAGEHPRVYVARGSHASYFQYAPGGYGGDTVVDGREFIIPCVRMLPVDGDADPTVFGWLRFPGAWGEPPAAGGCPGCQRGPSGPAFNSGGAKWKNPLQWGGRRLTREDLIANRTARFVVRGQARVHFFDAQGRHTGPLPGGRFERAAPGVAHLTVPGSDRQILLVPNMSPATPARLDVEGGTVASLDVLLPDGNGATTLRFGRVELSSSGRARLDLGGSVPVLQIDADGDGRFERTVIPHIDETAAPRESG
jgi:hypothetical protein